MRRLVILLLTILFYSCDNGTAKFGCDPPCESSNWLTFSYDQAILYTDTTGEIKRALDRKDLTNYTTNHKGRQISNDIIKTLDEALSCKIWICDKSKPKMELYNPQNLIVFTKNEKLVGYVATCDSSNLVETSPTSENSEIEILRSIIRRIKENEN